MYYPRFHQLPNLTEILHLKGQEGFPLLLIKPSIKSLAHGGSSLLASGLLARIILRDFARIAELPVFPVSGGLCSQQIELGRFFFISSEPGLYSGAESSIVDCLNKASLVPKEDIHSQCLTCGARLAGFPRSQARGRIANLRIDNQLDNARRSAGHRWQRNSRRNKAPVFPPKVTSKAIPPRSVSAQSRPSIPLFGARFEETNYIPPGSLPRPVKVHMNKPPCLAYQV